MSPHPQKPPVSTDDNPHAARLEAIVRIAASCKDEAEWPAAQRRIAAVAAMSDEEVEALMGGPDGGEGPEPDAPPQRHARGDFLAGL